MSDSPVAENQLAAGAANTTAAAADDELLQAFRRRPAPETFEPLLVEHLPALRGVVYRIVLNEHDTNDIVQETFISAYNNIDSFRGNARFGTWLCRIGVNRALSLKRKRKTARNSQDDVREQQRQRATRPDQQLMRAEHRDRVDQAMASLPDKLRAALVLSVVDGRPTAEVAEICGCSAATVYWRIHQARKKLKYMLKE